MRVHRRLAVLTLPALFGGLIVLPALAATATHAADAPGNGVYLQSAVAKVTSSSHRTLHLDLLAFDDPTADELTVTLSANRPNGTQESHSWSFATRPGTMSVTSGNVRIDTGQQLGGFGVIKAKFRKSSKTSSACPVGSDKQVRYHGTLSGTVYFNTKTGKRQWGAVGSQHRAFRFKGTNTLYDVPDQCLAIGTAACRDATYWAVDYDPTSKLHLSGSVIHGRRTTSTLVAERSVNLSAPKHASRDDVLVTNEPVPKQDNSKFTIKTSGKQVTGSAVITTTSEELSSYRCREGGQLVTRGEIINDGTWSNRDMIVHFQATGKVKALRTGGSAGFRVDSA